MQLFLGGENSFKALIPLSAKPMRSRTASFIYQSHCKFKILWKIKIVKLLLNNKDRNNQSSNVIYDGTCSCQANYVGETSRNLR